MTARRGALLAVVAIAAIAARPVRAQERQWRQVESDRVVVSGELSRSTLAAVACDLETAAAMMGPPDGAPGEPLSVIAVEGAGDARTLLPQFWERRGPRPLGAYWSGLYGHHIVVRVDARPEERLRRVLHEYAHYVTRLSNDKPARWIDEGLSEIWEGASIESGRVVIGLPIAEHLKTLRSATDWIAVDELVAATSLPRDRKRLALFYAQSWALVHYLMFDTPASRALLDIPLAADKVPTDQQLRDHILGPLGRTRSIRVPAAGACPPEPQFRTVPTIESLVLRAQTLADGERPDAALPLIYEAIRLEPGHAEAMEVLGFVHFAGNRPTESAAIFDQLIASGRGSHVAYYYRAALAGPIPERSDGSGRVSQLEYLREALRRDPGFAPARERLRELSGRN